MTILKVICFSLVYPSELHPPAVDRTLFNQSKQAVHCDTDADDRLQSGEDVGNLQLILVLVDEPADASRARTRVEIAAAMRSLEVG
jgi:hypothetical protein